MTTDNYKVGNEFLPYHPSASHVQPDYRDGWNDCFKKALTQASERVFIDVRQERNKQDTKWGGAAHDDRHTTAKFVQFIVDRAGMASVDVGKHEFEKARNRIVQIAALAVAAVESMDRRKDILDLISAVANGSITPR